MEAFCYDLTLLLGLRAVYAKVIKEPSTSLIGAFSKLEFDSKIACIYHIKELTGKKEMSSEQLANWLYSNYKSVKIIKQLAKQLILDVITGQLDRRMSNVAILYINKTAELYQPYDNGLCLHSTADDINAIRLLSSYHTYGRTGTAEEIIQCLKRITAWLKTPIKIQSVSKQSIMTVLNKADRFNEITILRKEAMIQFIWYHLNWLLSERVICQVGS